MTLVTEAEGLGHWHAGALSMTEESAETDEIATWLLKNAMPLSRLTPGGVSDDLLPLKKILSDVRVVGLGEATHGTREFFQVRHRLLQFLVIEMGFNTLAIEGSYSAAQSINDYVLSGTGDRSSLLTGLDAVMWDVEEFAEVLDWLRAYNESISDAGRVRFLGLDIWNTRVARNKVLTYLQVVAPDRVAAAEEMFREMALAETRGMTVAHELISRELLLKLQQLLELFLTSREMFLNETSVADYAKALQNLKVMLQWVSANLDDDLSDAAAKRRTLNNFARSRCMSENLVQFMDRDKPDAKVVVWAHNFHLGVGFQDSNHGSMRNTGHYLRERFGSQYYVFGLEFNRGAYLARLWLPDNTPGDQLRIITVPLAPVGSLPWRLSRAAKRNLMLDLRAPSRDQSIERWLETSQVTHCIGWGYVEPPSFYAEMAVSKGYDGIIFIENTSATTPTKNACQAVSAKASH